MIARKHSRQLGGFIALLLASILLAPANDLKANQPPWAGDNATTRQGYEFTTDDTSPVPEILDNEYGDPEATVSVSAPFGTGWQDPILPFTTSGVNDDGAWDLGPQGSIEVSVPIGPPLSDPGLYYRVELFVYAVAYELPLDLPEIDAPGLSLENVSLSTAVVQPDIIGRYVGMTWSAEADISTGNSLTVRFAGTNFGALIDSIQVYSRFTLMGNPQNGYAAWVEENYPGVSDPAIVGCGAMPEGDGLKNGLKYFLGMGKEARFPVIELREASPGSLVLRHTRDKNGAPDVNAIYQWSLDLQSWYAGGDMIGGISVNFSSLIEDNSHPDYDVMEVTALVSGTPQKLFTRLRVTKENE